LAFFLLASVPPSLPRKESSFFLDGGDLGVGDLGEEGDFWGEVAMMAPAALGDGGDGSAAPMPWEAAPGSERKRNYFKHLRQLLLRSPGSPAPSLLPPALPLGRARSPRTAPAAAPSSAPGPRSLSPGPPLPAPLRAFSRGPRVLVVPARGVWSFRLRKGPRAGAGLQPRGGAKATLPSRPGDPQLFG